MYIYIYIYRCICITSISLFMYIYLGGGFRVGEHLAEGHDRARDEKHLPLEILLHHPAKGLEMLKCCHPATSKSTRPLGNYARAPKVANAWYR